MWCNPIHIRSPNILVTVTVTVAVTDRGVRMHKFAIPTSQWHMMYIPTAPANKSNNSRYV